MATATARASDDGTPPPIVAKAGRYTVFLTPPAAGKPKEPSSLVAASATKFKTPGSTAPNQPPSFTKLKYASSPIPNQDTSKPAPSSTKPAAVASLKPPTVPVQVPPPQFVRETKHGGRAGDHGGAFGFFWDAVARVQDAHATLDERLAEWFGLNQSKYQWALNDYYESKGSEKASGKRKEHVGKCQNV